MRLNTIGRLSLVLSLIAALPGGAYGKILKLDTPSTSLVLDAEKGKALKFLYYGGRPMVLMQPAKPRSVPFMPMAT